MCYAVSLNKFNQDHFDCSTAEFGDLYSIVRGCACFRITLTDRQIYLFLANWLVSPKESCSLGNLTNVSLGKRSDSSFFSPRGVSLMAHWVWYKLHVIKFPPRMCSVMLTSGEGVGVDYSAVYFCDLGMCLKEASCL